MTKFDDFEKENLGRILRGFGDWYMAKLLRLISQSDWGDMEQMHKAYPAEVEAVYKYQTGKKWDER